MQFSNTKLMKLKIIFLFIVIFFFNNSIFSIPTNGWEIGNTNSILYISDTNVFDTRDNIRYLPPRLNAEQIHLYALFVSEYYVARNDKAGLTNLVSLLKSDRNNYESLANLILIFWRIEKGESAEAIVQLDDLIYRDENPIIVNLAKVIRSNFKKIELNSEIIEGIKTLNCNRSKQFYSYCRFLKLSVQLEHLVKSSDYPHRDFLNLDRVMAHFFEEPELVHISFMNRIAQDFPTKLAYLGFAYEAVNFQKMLANVQKLNNTFDPTELERLSYYQMLNDDLVGAEETLVYISKKTPFSINKNFLFLKLGAIAYFRKDYKLSLTHYLELNLKDWDKSIKNPFYEEYISINGARSLISLSLWKSKSAVNAVRALNKLSSESKITEENLFIRLRIAQIVMNDKPSVAEKISEDILYIAQSKGWKRVEYAATLMNGYCSIISKKYRKATVQFTKSYGIIGGSEPVFSSDWMRQSGMLFARVQGRERGNHLATYRSLLHAMLKEEPSDDILGVKNFLDSRFDTEAFFNNAIHFLITTKNYRSLVEFLYYYQKMRVKSPVIANKSLLQFPDVIKRMKLYRSFRPPADIHYSSSSYSKLRDAESKQMVQDSETFDVNSIQSLKDPFVAAFSFNEKIYVISYNPNIKYGWNYSIHNSLEYRTSGYYNKIFASIPFLKTADNVQIFMNPIGIDLYQSMKKMNSSLNVRLFYGFNKPSSKKTGSELSPIAVSCDSGNETTVEGIKYLATDYFEGVKSFTGEDRLHIWNTKDLANKDTSSIEKFEWRCQNGSTISFNKMLRRVDLRMVPEAMVFSSTLFPWSSLDAVSLDYYFWSDFWMRKGVNSMYYVDKFESSKTSFSNTVKILSKSANSTDDFGTIQSQLKSSDKEVLILTRGLH